MAIATDAVNEKEAKALKNEIETDLQAVLKRENVSVRIIVKPEDGISMYSLSKIINDWLSDINQDKLSTISKISPIPVPLTPELKKIMMEAWTVLIAV